MPILILPSTQAIAPVQYAAVNIRGTRTYLNTSSTAGAVTALPVTTQAGDFAVLAVNAPAGAALSAPVSPAGGSWTTVLDSDVGLANNSRIGVFATLLAQADVDQTTVTVVRTSSSSPWAMAMLVFSGVGSLGTVGTLTNVTANTGAFTYPPLAISTPASVVVAIGVSRTSATLQSLHTTPGSPAGWQYGVEAVNVAGPSVVRTAWLDLLPALGIAGQSTAATAATLAPASNGGTILLELRAASSPLPSGSAVSSAVFAGAGVTPGRAVSAQVNLPPARAY